MKKIFLAVLVLCATIAANAQNVYGESNGHQYVDLGLSVKWATCNVGATTPEEWGGYYSWGELSGKDNYSKENYEGYHFTQEWDEVTGGGKDADGFDIPLVRKHHDPVTKWPDFGKDISGGFHDVAKAEWGAEWRLPTYKEYQELLKKCTWEWTAKNDVRGYKVTGPNGRWIFLPAAGYRAGLAVNRAETRGYYWTSTMPKELETQPMYVYLGKNSHALSKMDRYMGLSVRAVCNK